MATLTITSPATVNAGLSYTQNVGRAARALLTALLAITPQATERPVQATRRNQRDDMPLYHLYSLAAPYDALMPNQMQELQMMACRDR
jgi:hypothetical protein